MDINELKRSHRTTFGSTGKQYCFSAPGRTEIGGNHTDHQHGKILAAAINLDTKAAVCKNQNNVIRIKSEGYDYFEVDLKHLELSTEEYGTTAALAKGVAAGIAQLGHCITGFDAYIASTVLPGSGLSSSAAFEVLIGTIINEIDHCGLTPIEIAKVGQYAENVYFGKPSGLMDQLASSVGNLLAVDFADVTMPVVKPLDVDFNTFDHSLCIIDSGADHANLTDEYAAITEELKSVCGFFEKKFLRDVDEGAFYANMTSVRKKAGDRAVIRAMHIFDENKRVSAQVEALEKGKFNSFLDLVNDSGRSSWTYLQNVVPTGCTTHQDLAIALALCKKFLDGQGACRVHGGGFAGTIQAFVPNDMLNSFKTKINCYLGDNSCHVLNIRREGGIREE